MSLITLTIGVTSLDQVLLNFDQIEVHRSITTIDGAYEEITDVLGPTAAQIDGTAAGPFTLDGETLVMEVNGVSYSVTFSGTDPLALSEVISQINAEIPNFASEVPTDTDKLRLTTDTKGTGATIDITAGVSASALGLSTTRTAGKANRIPLTPTTTDYTFYDIDGDEGYFYKTRYSSTTAPTQSTFSDPRQGSIETVAPSAELIAAELYLVNGAGAPIADRTVRFVLLAAVSVDTTQYQSIPGVDSTVSVQTTETGYATIDLLKGGKYRMIIEGTAFIREFTVPDSGPFDVLALAGSSPDPFDIIQTPALAIKVTV